MTTHVSTAPVGTAEPSTADPGQVEAFAGRLVSDIAATMTTILCSLGDKLGLFAALSSAGPATAAELAQRQAARDTWEQQWEQAMTIPGAPLPRGAAPKPAEESVTVRRARQRVYSDRASKSNSPEARQLDRRAA